MLSDVQTRTVFTLAWGTIYGLPPASPPPASPPFRQGRRYEKSVPVDPRSAVPLPDTTPPPPITEAWPELGGGGGSAAGLGVIDIIYNVICLCLVSAIDMVSAK